MFEVEGNMHEAGGPRARKEVLMTMKECAAICKCQKENLLLLKENDRNGTRECHFVVSIA